MNSDTGRIAFFDSGIGGLTVLHEALRVLPDEDFIYFADTSNAPYGTKTKDEVRRLVGNAAALLAEMKIKALVVACNTATSVAIEELRRTYPFPIIGMEPAVKPAVEKSEKRSRRVLVTATPLTIREEKLKNLIARIDNEKIVDLLPLPSLVTFAENGQLSGPGVESYLSEQFSSFDLSRYGTVVLGCTHFIYFRPVIRKLLPEGIEIIDGNRGTINNLKRILSTDPEKGKGEGRIDFYCSGERITEDRGLDRFRLLLSSLERLTI